MCACVPGGVASNFRTLHDPGPRRPPRTIDVIRGQGQVGLVAQCAVLQGRRCPLDVSSAQGQVHCARATRLVPRRSSGAQDVPHVQVVPGSGSGPPPRCTLQGAAARGGYGHGGPHVVSHGVEEAAARTAPGEPNADGKRQSTLVKSFKVAINQAASNHKRCGWRDVGSLRQHMWVSPQNESLHHSRTSKLAPPTHDHPPGTQYFPEPSVHCTTFSAD